MNERFEFKRITRDLVHDLALDVERGHSSAVMGPPYCGKTVLLRQLAHALRKKRPILLSFQTEAPLSEAVDVKAAISAATSGWPGGNSVDNGEFLDPIKRIAEAGGAPVPLLVSAVDGLAYHLARRFLHEIKDLASDGRVVAVLGGEFGLRDLVSGQNGVFVPDKLYVVQGFGREEFREIADVYFDRAKKLGISFDDGVFDALWEVTGGNDSLLGWIFWTVLERSLSGDPSTQPPLDRPSIIRLASQIAQRGVRGAHNFVRADRILSREPDSWGQLTLLAEGKDVELQDPGRPGPLEFSGVAIRDGGLLKPASIMMAQFLRAQYDEQRLGDFYGRIGNWGEAFRRYARAQPSPLRPLDPLDRTEVATNITAFRTFLHSREADVTQLLGFLTNGLRYLLGFAEVTFWDRLEGGAWRLHRLNSLQISDETVLTLQEVLPVDTGLSSGEWLLPSDHQECAVGWVLDGDRDERQAIVVVSDHMVGRRPLAPERRAFALAVLSEFSMAHSKALELERERGKSLTREVYSEATRELLKLLERGPCSTEHIVQTAAEGVRKLRYKRVLVCLVTPDGLRVKGVLDECDENSVKIAAMTDWPLTVPLRDVQPWVVVNRTSVRIRDARREPLANPDVVKAAGMTALAIVPIFSGTDTAVAEVVGTIHVERADGSLPSKSEVADLEDFGKQLGIVLGLTERIRLIDAGLSRLECPVMIVDARLRTRYANRAASHLLCVTEGWTGLDSLQESRGIARAELRDALVAAVSGVRRMVWWPSRATATENILCYEGICENIRSESQRIHGATLILADQQFSARMIRAVQALLDLEASGDSLLSLLKAGQSLGRCWGRAYRVSTNDPNTLLFECGFDEADGPITPKIRHGIKLPSRTLRGTETWESIERHHAVLFEYDPDGINGQDRNLPNGLSITCVTKPHCPVQVEKRIGDVWADFPVFQPNGSVVGKVTLNWGENVSPLVFEMMISLSKVSPLAFQSANEQGTLAPKE